MRGVSKSRKIMQLQKQNSCPANCKKPCSVHKIAAAVLKFYQKPASITYGFHGVFMGIVWGFCGDFVRISKSFRKHYGYLMDILWSSNGTRPAALRKALEISQEAVRKP